MTLLIAMITGGLLVGLMVRAIYLLGLIVAGTVALQAEAVRVRDQLDTLVRLETDEASARSARIQALLTARGSGRDLLRQRLQQRLETRADAQD